MPRRAHLLRREGRYYIQVRLRGPLKAVLGRTHYRRTLGTGDARSAAVRLEGMMGWLQRVNASGDEGREGVEHLVRVNARQLRDYIAADAPRDGLA